jgi:glycosyltransferase involved in cell wall biosynthesis
MRVLHLTRDLPPRSAGGISTAVGWLVGGMRQEGWPQAVVSFDGWRPRRQAARAELDGGVLRIQGRPGEEVRAFAEAHRPDVTLVHDPMIAEAVGRLPGRRIAVVHVDHAQLRRVRGLDAATQSEEAQGRVLTAADAVIAPSEAIATRLRARGPATARARFGVEPCEGAGSGGGRDVVYLGRLDAAKGTEVFLRAMDGLDPPVLAGGLPHNPRAEARWQQRWPDARWRGWLDPVERDDLLRSAALLAVPSLEETLGLVALEALRLGVPVVASAVGGLADVVEDTGGGVLVPPGDVAALRGAIEALLADPDRRRMLGERGRRRVTEGWTWAALRGEWAAALQG